MRFVNYTFFVLVAVFLAFTSGREFFVASLRKSIGTLTRLRGGFSFGSSITEDSYTDIVPELKGYIVIKGSPSCSLNLDGVYTQTGRSILILQIESFKDNFVGFT